MPRPTTALLAPVLVAVALAAGCGSGSNDATSDDPATLFQRRAEQVADAWTRGDLLQRWRSGVVAAQDLTKDPDWMPRPNLKASFSSGWIRTATALPTTPGTGTVRYADGTTVLVHTLDAQTAYDQMVNPRSGPCPTADDVGTGYEWLTITAVRRVSTSLLTARGPAELPAWSFTVQGLPEPLVRVAVAAVEPGDLEPVDLPALPADDRRVLLTGQDVVGHTPTSLTITLGSGTCDAALRAHVLETRDVVVVGGTALRPPSGQMCNSSLRLEEVTVPLEADLGDRPVVDAASGRPLLPRVLPEGQHR
jgi:hypothetical protein